MINIYCGNEDNVSFFEEIVRKLKLNIKYRVITIDGEYEIVIDEICER